MTSIPPSQLLSQRLATVETRLSAACQRVGRSREEVTLVAVTKTVSSRVAAMLPALGLHDLGENRPQSLWSKAEALAGLDVRWHLIGHLQRNKIERTLPLVCSIHSVDSLRLLQALDSAAMGRENPLPILLEVNASQEASKHGFSPSEIIGLGPSLVKLTSLRVTGLMTMAAYGEDPERCRPTFVLLRQLRDQLRSSLKGAHPLEHLSMGMSNDFEIAVEEGATIVRLGTVLFEGLEEV